MDVVGRQVGQPIEASPSAVVPNTVFDARCATPTESQGPIAGRALISLHDQVVELRYPAGIAADVDHLYRDSIVCDATPGSRIVIDEAEGERFSIDADGIRLVDDLTRGDLATFVMEAVVRGLVQNLTTAVALHAGAVTFGGAAALIAGPTGSGKSSFVAWLVANGFDYMSDEISLLFPGETAILGLPRALVLKPGAAEKVQALEAYKDVKSVVGGEHIMLRPRSLRSGLGTRHTCQLIVFPQFAVESELRVESLTAAQAALRLIGNNLNARNLADGGFRAIASFARQVPAVVLRYGNFEQLEGTADRLVRLLLDGDPGSGASKRFLSLFANGSVPAQTVATSTAAPRRYEIPAPTPRGQAKKLTIGMATYDDYDGVYFSLQALRLYHPEVIAYTEFLVVDNHPDGPCAEALKELEQAIPNYRYVPFNSRSGTAVRDRVFAEAGGQFVLCMDCHVFIVPGALQRLVDYLDANADTRDLLQGPLIYDDLNSISTHFHPAWQAGMYGYWETDARGDDPDAPPFEIPMQGLGVFACRRTAWPGFNPRFRGFGGEEGYIHEKFRQNGARTLCLPFLRWMHRFHRPMGVPYANRWDDRVRNYVIGFRELGLPTAELEQHFREILGDAAGPMLAQAEQELDGVGDASPTSSNAPS